MGGKMSGGGGSGGASAFDMGLISDWLGGATNAMDHRYAQLGLAIPQGDPAHAGQIAAASGQNLQPGGRSTANIMDDQGLSQMAQAAIGQIQGQNINNPAAPGSPANQNFQNQQFGQALGGLGSLAAGALV